MTSALTNGVKGGKWFSRIDKAVRSATLAIAWRKVAANTGAAGVDGVSVERFAARSETDLARTRREPEGTLVSAESGQTGGDPQGRRQDASAGDPHGQGPHRADGL